MDENRVKAVFASHSSSLHRYASRLTGDPDLAEDLVQTAFIRLSRESEVQSEKAWLFRVVANLAINNHRSLSRRKSLLRLGFHRGDSDDVVAGPDETYERRELRGLVRDALQKLSDRDRVLLLMREEGFTHAEIAESIGSTTKSVGTLLARALVKAGKHLADIREALK